MKAEALVEYAEYVRNTAGNATVENFDEDWEPIGPMIRPHLIPKYARVDEHGKLVLTPAGKDLAG